MDNNTIINLITTLVAKELILIDDGESLSGCTIEIGRKKEMMEKK